ncbi:response regulator [sulfur-oxidizing endosymbiont of Gigantopelta aegis]|uniref:response regulator n=1 Tax=sulfur-oxidizing endosymbiont of Gigantopelta aegis TaxID=2794934 RepID=UPI0018DB0E19|nr:response regulator [sulfur-oxidizing endosymbiont of Gigantopelta aegis]
MGLLTLLKNIFSSPEPEKIPAPVAKIEMLQAGDAERFNNAGNADSPANKDDFNHSSIDSDTPHKIDATVLIVDDSKTQIAACQKWLGAAGYKTLTALDGKEGIIKATKKQPDLILMDIVMPNVNGFQATRYLKRQSTTKHIPIVLISGEEQSSGKAWAKKLGACCFMVKPMDKDKLLNLTQRIVSHYSIAHASSTHEENEKST